MRNSHSFYSEYEIDFIKQHYHIDMDSVQIGEILDRTASSVSKQVIKLGLNIERPKRLGKKITPEIGDYLFKSYKEKSYRQMSKELGIDSHTIRNYLLSRHSVINPRQHGSDLEEVIADFLDKHRVSYEREKTFDNSFFRADFFIEPNIIIEVQGVSHTFDSRTMKRDKRKREFYRENDFELIELWNIQIKDGSYKKILFNKLPGLNSSNCGKVADKNVSKNVKHTALKKKFFKKHTE